MHPYSADALARSQREDREHEAQQAWLAAEVRRAAMRSHHRLRRAPFPRLRHAVGARLVEVGLRLTVPRAAH